MSKRNIAYEIGKYVYPAFKDKVECEYGDINTTMEIVLMHELIHYLSTRGINLILIEGPNKRKITEMGYEPYLFQKIDISEVMQDRAYMEKFFHGDKSLLDYAYDENAGLLYGNRITTNGIHLMSAWFRSQWVNVSPMGERKNVDSVVGPSQNDVYIYGSCLTFGLFADDQRTFPSYLQKLINDSDLAGTQVHNLGVKGQNCVLNDLLFVLNTPLRSNDTVMLVEKFSKEMKTILSETGIKLYDFSEYLNTASIGDCSFLNSAFHCNDSIYKLLADYAYKLIANKSNHSWDGYKSKSLHSYFEENNRIKFIDSDGLIDKIFINDLKETLQKEKFDCLQNAVVGSLVMAANPFTWGHARLVDLAARQCDYLYVFVIEDKHFDIPFQARYEITREYVTKHHNCKCIATGSYFGADFLFPEYHDRKSYEKRKISNPIIDTVIFAKHIAPILGINRRYLGAEDSDSVTRQFNDYLMSILPQYGIEVIVVPRFTTAKGHQKISGSYARELIESQQASDELQDYLPPSSIKTLSKFMVHSNAKQVKGTGL